MGEFEETRGETSHVVRKAEGGYVLQCDNPLGKHTTDSKNHKEGQACTGNDGKCGYALKKVPV